MFADVGGWPVKFRLSPGFPGKMTNFPVFSFCLKSDGVTLLVLCSIPCDIPWVIFFSLSVSAYMFLVFTLPLKIIITEIICI